jgi:hypothetical protein
MLRLQCTVDPAYKDFIQTSDLTRIVEAFIENVAYKNNDYIRTIFTYKRRLNSSSGSVILIKLQSKHILVGRFDCISLFYMHSAG